MAQMTWEKARTPSADATNTAQRGKRKLAVVGFVVMAVMGFMILSGTLNGQMAFITVDEMWSRPELVGKTIKVTGAVVGPSIHFDADTKTIHFTMAHITLDTAQLQDLGGLAKALHVAVSDTSARRVEVVVHNQPMPDLLQNEAQAIITGKLGADGVFTADELLLKCPSKYESALPKQATK